MRRKVRRRVDPLTDTIIGTVSIIKQEMSKRKTCSRYEPVNSEQKKFIIEEYILTHFILKARKSKCEKKLREFFSYIIWISINVDTVLYHSDALSVELSIVKYSDSKYVLSWFALMYTVEISKFPLSCRVNF